MAGIDPFPRSYAKGVRLRRRSQRVPGEAGGAAGTLADVEAWLLGEALAVGDVLDFFEAFCWRMVRAMPAFERARASGKAALIELVTDPERISTRTTVTKLRASAK